MKMEKFKCPCCEEYEFEFGPGSYDICPICFWEDDKLQYKDPDYAGGANGISLNTARENYARIGVCDDIFAKRENTGEYVSMSEEEEFSEEE